MSDSGPDVQQAHNPEVQERLTPWVVGVLATLMIALGVYMSYGGTFHFKHDVDVSASSRSTPQ